MGSSKAVGEQTTRKSRLFLALPRPRVAPAPESKVKFLSPLAVPSSASGLDDSAARVEGGKGFRELSSRASSFECVKWRRRKKYH